MLKIFRTFRDDENGTAALEMVLTLPILLWVTLSTLVYFDVYRAESISTRAALTMADMFSRELDPITPAYLNGADRLLEALSAADAETAFRITLYYYDDDDKDYKSLWSRNRGMRPNLNDTRLNAYKSQLPLMADQERALLLETSTTYNAPYSLGLTPAIGSTLEDVKFSTFTVISPRFGKSVCWKQGVDSDAIC